VTIFDIIVANFTASQQKKYWYPCRAGGKAWWKQTPR